MQFDRKNSRHVNDHSEVVFCTRPDLSEKTLLRRETLQLVSPKLGSSPEDTPDEYLVLWIMNDYWDLKKGSVDITAQKCSTRAVLCEAQYLQQMICMLVIR